MADEEEYPGDLEQKSFLDRIAQKRADAGKRLFMIHPKKAKRGKRGKMKKLSDAEAFLAGRR